MAIWTARNAYAMTFLASAQRCCARPKHDACPDRLVPVSSKLPLLRVALLLLLGALGVHEGRYRLAYGSQSSEVLAGHGHGYLMVLAPIISVAVGLVFAQALVSVARVTDAGSRRQVRVRRLWPASTCALLSLYVGQELLEGVLAAGHPGWSEVFGAGGWFAIPLSLLFGGFVALGLRVVERLEELRVDGPQAPRPGGSPACLSISEATAAAVIAAGVLACHLAGRAPPRIFRLEFRVF